MQAESGGKVNIQIMRPAELTADQAAHLTARIAHPDHALDKGPTSYWLDESWWRLLYVPVDIDSGDCIGLLFADGPKERTGVAWWLDSVHRGRHLGIPVVLEFAKYLKRTGVTGVQSITIDTFAGKYHGQSSSLARAFRREVQAVCAS
jgi:hypothetical protein